MNSRWASQNLAPFLKSERTVVLRDLDPDAVTGFEAPPVALELIADRAAGAVEPPGPAVDQDGGAVGEDVIEAGVELKRLGGGGAVVDRDDRAADHRLRTFE